MVSFVHPGKKVWCLLFTLAKNAWCLLGLVSFVRLPVPFAAREWCRGLIHELAALLWFGGGGHSFVAISISPE